MKNWRGNGFNPDHPPILVIGEKVSSLFHVILSTIEISAREVLKLLTKADDAACN
jgi:hypothetical protein